MLTITIGDDRLVYEDDGPRDHATMMAEFHQAVEGFITPFARDGEPAALQRETYCRFIIENTLTGLATMIPEA